MFFNPWNCLNFSCSRCAMILWIYPETNTKRQFSYIKFDKMFLSQYIFDVALPITLQLDKFVFKRNYINLCANFHLPRFFIKNTYFPVFGLHSSSISCVKFPCKWDRIPWTIFRTYVRFVLSEGQVNWKGNFHVNLTKFEYWTNIFPNLDANLKIL